MSFVIGQTSRAKLQGVHPSLVLVVERAIQLTAQDFGVHDGVRTLERQRELVAAGASKTMNSKHLPQTDGFGHAVDLVPYIAGQLRWEWPPIYVIASAVHAAALELDIEIVWGGSWDRKLNVLNGTVDGLKKAVADYASRHPGPDFLDGPHYQLA